VVEPVRIAAIGEFIGKLGPPPYKNSTGRMGTWNAGINAGFPNRGLVQGVILHAYEPLTLPVPGDVVCPHASNSSDWGTCAGQQALRDEFLVAGDARTGTPSGVEQVLSSPYWAF